MSWITNQYHIRNSRYNDVNDAQTNSIWAIDWETCFVFSIKKNYYYEHWSTAVIDWLNILSANGWAGRRINIKEVSNNITDEYILNSVDITNWYIDLSHTPYQTKNITLTIWGLINYDYTIITNRLTFWPSLNLTIWDEVDVTYYY